MDLEKFSTKKGNEERSKEEASQSLFRYAGKRKYDRGGCAERLQNDNMRPYHANDKKTARGKHVGSPSQ